MIDRGGDGQKIGERLLALSKRLFHHLAPCPGRHFDMAGLSRTNAPTRARRSSKPLEMGQGVGAPRREQPASRSLKWKRGCGPLPIRDVRADEQRI